MRVDSFRVYWYNIYAHTRQEHEGNADESSDEEEEDQAVRALWGHA